MSNYLTSESNGMFACIENSSSFASFDDSGGSLGVGPSQVVRYFRSEEARSLFMSMQPKIDDLARELRNAQYELRQIKTIRGANANLKRARAEKKALAT